ncbi:S-adenosyl-l-methionine hydroxide adenosyltransferase family protein [Embleya sp. NPDC008237]|uniref:SAM hydrolase/SAM-dependent halogenase family protein n=1 Tax=Embleya sp. NPDC008237 TaxID=3363978 RepID=UPI0036E702B1
MAAHRITLTTDYGLLDGFVAACHGVIAGLAPAVPVVDVTHLVPPGDVRRGALVLARTVPWFPAGSVHVAVVDPGVGTARRAIVLRAGGHLLVGPDNGLLPWAAHALGGIEEIREITNPALTLAEVSRTFHGRDVFAPVAAHLALGTPLAEVGPPAGDPVELPAPVPGEVLVVDHFGNVQLAHAVADFAGADLLRVEVGDRAYRVPLRNTFGEVPAGELVGYQDSDGLLAVSVNGGDAAELLGVRAGDRVRVSPSC